MRDRREQFDELHRLGMCERECDFWVESLVKSELYLRAILGWVDPDCLGERGHLRWACDEALWVLREGFVHHELALREDLGGAPEEDVGGSEASDAGVPVLVVVPGEEAPAEVARVVEALEALGDLGAT